jgi:DNA-binding NarL/FixJ family response regulator
VIRVLIVDDHELFRHGIRMVLVAEPDFEVVGEARDGREAIALAAAHRPHVVLMDVRMPRVDGVEAASAICSDDPSIRVVMLTVSDSTADLVAAIEAGACGYLLKEVAMDQLPESLRVVFGGGSVVSPTMTARLVEHVRLASTGRARRGRLTAREREVTGHVVAGRSNREIADLVGVAENTVKNHVRAILEKLGARSRSEAAAIARRQGLA